ncbi:MAG TPA: TRAP transporter small permease [Candidatus Tectomicrobia bacterium]|nr:TRAP transporter small permease [Candidatus Tectomicrobia bacterium]
MMPAARRGLEALETSLNLLSAAILFFLMFYVTAEVAMRYLFNAPLAGHLEATQLLIAPAVFLALSWVQARRGHVGMDLLHERLSPRARAAVDIVTLAIALATFLAITWFSWASAVEAWEIGDVTPTANLQTWWSKLSVPLGCALLCVRLLMQLVESLVVAVSPGSGRWTP